MNCRISKLENGLRILTTPIPSSPSATVTVWVGVGSRQEEDRIAGLSHFLEHIVFKGSKKRPTSKDISQEIDALGAEMNAGTTQHWTNFYLKGRVENLEKIFDLLSDIVLNPLLKEEDIEREKGVIIQEIKMYEDMPIRFIWDLFDRVIFKGNTLGRDIIGSRETVANLKKDDFLRYRKMHYYPENMLITVAGGIDKKETNLLAQKYFGQLEKRGRNEEKIKKFVSFQDKPQVLLQNKKTEQTHFILGFLGLPLDHKERYVKGVLSAILGEGTSSRLWLEVREKRGLAYHVRTVVDQFIDTGFMATYAGVNPEKIEEAIKIILDEHYFLASGKKEITGKELSKAKEFIKGHLALELEDSKVINEFFGIKGVLLNKTDSLEEAYKGIDKVTKEDVVKLAQKLFVPKHLNLAIIGPYKDKEKFENLLY
jgi:predicted Zn-dependent peptidase